MHPGIQGLLRAQSVLLALVGGIAYALGGGHAAYSAAAGGVVAFLPNVFFARKAGRITRGKSARDIVNDFYVGEAIKLVLAAVLFAAAFHVPGVQALPLFGGFMAVSSAFWLALLRNDQTDF